MLRTMMPDVFGISYNKWRDPMFLRGLFNDGGGQGGGGAGTGGGGATGGDGGAVGGGAQPFATFASEADLTARLDTEGKARLEALAKELGFDSVDDMKEAAKAKKEADEKAKTELEKAQEAVKKAETEKKAALETANQRLINAEIKLAAQAAGFVDPADAIALIDRAGVKVDDQGNVTGVKEAVEKLAKDKPHLIGQGGKPSGSPGSQGNGGRQSGTGEGESLAKKLAEKLAENNKKLAESQNLYFK